MVPQNYITLEKEEDMAQMRKLLDNLEDNDDVQAVWHNFGRMRMITRVNAPVTTA